MIGEIIDHYEIIEKLGGGGMGVVYKAKDLKLDRFVALKFLPPYYAMDEDFKSNIIKEAKIAATLDHPNICNIHEVGETEDERIFIAMAYYEGETLKKKIENNSLKPEDVESIALQIAKGLERAHEKGIIHRDIKPANIFITNKNEVKILDFGVAKIEGEYSVLDADKAKGTIAYMSPEQILGKEIDNRTDIWAFGVLLYELFSGEKPFKYEFEQSAVYSIVNDEIDINKLKLNNKNNYFKSIITKCLKKNKEDRFQNFNDIFTSIIAAQPNLEIYNSYNKNRFISISKKSRYLFSSFAIALLILIWIFIDLNKVSITPVQNIIVSDFKNFTNEKFFDYSLSEAITISLRQSPKINIMPKIKIANTLSLMKLSTDAKFNNEVAIKVGKREGIPFIVSGEISKDEDKYILTAGIIDVSSGEKIKLHLAKIESIENIMNVIDNLAADLREDLGESKKSISNMNLPLAQVTTPSIEALNLYSKGSLLEGQGKYSESIELKEKALTIDSQFVKAISDLAYDYQKIGNFKKAIFYHNKILPLINRVSEREKFSILTIYYGPTFEMDYKKAYQYAIKWTTLYPNDNLAFATLGHLAMFAGKYNIALDANKKSLDLDSAFAGTLYNNTAFTYALNNETKLAVVNFKMSKKIRPNYTDIDVYLAKTFLLSNNLDSAKNILESIIQKTKGIQQIKVLALLGSYYHYTRQYNLALEKYNLGINICKNENLEGDESYLHYLKSDVELEVGNIKNFENELEKSIELTESPYFELGLAGISFARSGMESMALSILNRIEKIEDDNPHFTKRKLIYINLIKGIIEIKNKEYDKGLKNLNAVNKLYCGDPIYLFAQKEIASTTGIYNDSLAIQLYQNLFLQKGEIFMSFLPSVRSGGNWYGKIFADSQYELGLIYSKMKDTNNAEIYFKKVLELWKGSNKKDKKIQIINEKLSDLRKLNEN